MRFTCSRPVEDSFTWRRNWQHPSRREFVHGRIKPLDEPSTIVSLWAVGFVVAAFVAPMVMSS